MSEKRKKQFKEENGVTYMKYEGDDLWLVVKEDQQ